MAQVIILIFSSLFAEISFATFLSQDEKELIADKLQDLPITRKYIWNLLFPTNGHPLLADDFQNELETILKISLLEADTKVTKLTPAIRNELNLSAGIAAFHKQGYLPFEITLSRAGNITENKTNDTIRQLTNDNYFRNEHNVFVADALVNREVNTVILLFHELSHAAFDQMLIRDPQYFVSHLSEVLPKKDLKKLIKGTGSSIRIDGDLYDLFSERFAFELEYRLDRQASAVLDSWPTFYRFDGVYDDEYVDLIDGFVRRVYNIDHPLLVNARAYPLNHLLKH